MLVDKLKKIGLILLYPHLAVIICLLPVSVALLVLSLVYLAPNSIIAIMTYLLSFYVLLVICFRIPSMIAFFKNFKQENKLMQRWFSDVNLRVKVSLYGSLLWNISYAVFQLFLGFYYKSFWFGSMFGYYIILGIMRFFLLNHTRKFKANEQSQIETKKYVLCGWLLLLMNLALGVVVTFIVAKDKTFQYDMITTIAMAAYSFFTFTFAIVSLVRYKKYNSSVYMAAKILTLIGACVSMLILETTMLTTFGENASPLFKQIILSASGIAVVGFALVMAIIMIVKGHKKLKQEKVH